MNNEWINKSIKAINDQNLKHVVTLFVHESRNPKYEMKTSGRAKESACCVAKEWREVAWIGPAIWRCVRLVGRARHPQHTKEESHIHGLPKHTETQLVVQVLERQKVKYKWRDDLWEINRFYQAHIVAKLINLYKTGKYRIRKLAKKFGEEWRKIL